MTPTEYVSIAPEKSYDLLTDFGVNERSNLRCSVWIRVVKSYLLQFLNRLRHRLLFFSIQGLDLIFHLHHGYIAFSRGHLTFAHLSYSIISTEFDHQVHLQRVVAHFTTEQIANNRLQLKATIFIVRYLAFQAIAFRGRDEIFSSLNRGNFHESLAKVKKAIREEIGDAKFCIIVDEARDESMKEQMAVVFRYVDAEGFVKERFLGLIHVVDTAALTLKKGIYSLLSQHCLDIQNIRGQGYDGASNMRGMWNGLQALILNDWPYAYYIHCFVHRLQLALVKASKQVVPISHFFLTLLFLIKIVHASCKRNEQLKVVNANEIARLIDLEELETGSGLNQIGTLQRPVETRWSSHFRSVSSLLRMFSSTVEVLQNIIDNAIDGENRAEGESAYDGLTSFEFVFILHLEKEIMEITDKLYSQLQELNYRFNEDAMELLRRSSALESREALKSFRISDLCLLVKNFYPQDFIDYDKVLEKEVYHF
ncbi:zinc finger MYM-type protein 1-like [Quercus lobata]|uniref:zinc finger MYM-type protein 1-like n=1 Tax=Quercus lobata TaxID=97700 RepID=UPI00124513C3|nr:zinc finger MYM-type protein 1-like [Quercus lobata]